MDLLPEGGGSVPDFAGVGRGARPGPLPTGAFRRVVHCPAGPAGPLVGPSGAGKTTISHLIPRLYDVRSGAIRINGVDLCEATLDSIRRAMGVVAQDAHLFHDTIRANLRYAKPVYADLYRTQFQRQAALEPAALAAPL
jgi:ABC-type multidrug transport system fused ATPase/permease subunit